MKLSKFWTRSISQFCAMWGANTYN